jgi:uncharacterized protein (DUF433 family)
MRIHLLTEASQMNTIIQFDEQVMGGTPVFSGTRVPVATLIDYLEAGDSIDDFLDGFPTVERGQVIGFLEVVRRTKSDVIESIGAPCPLIATTTAPPVHDHQTA